MLGLRRLFNGRVITTPVITPEAWEVHRHLVRVERAEFPQLAAQFPVIAPEDIIRMLNTLADARLARSKQVRADEQGNKVTIWEAL